MSLTKLLYSLPIESPAYDSSLLEPLPLHSPAKSEMKAFFSESPDALLPSTVGPPKERLALYILHKHFALVPEHVESRALMHSARLGIPQGQLRLWVDLFPASAQPLPPPMDITPRRPRK